MAKYSTKKLFAVARFYRLPKQELLTPKVSNNFKKNSITSELAKVELYNKI